MAMTDWSIISRSLTARLFSTVTTVITVAVAVAMLLTLLMMREAGVKAFERGTGNMHLLVTRDVSPLESVLNSVFYARPPRRPIDWAKYQQLVAAAPYDFAIPTQIGDSYHGQPVLATTEEFFTRFQPVDKHPWTPAQGRFFKSDFEVVAGARAARTGGLKLGDKITLTHGSGGSRGAGEPAPHEHSEYKFEVVGILEPSGSAHDRALFIPLQSSWILHAHDRIERDEAVARGGAPESEEDHAHEKLTDASDLTDGDRLITGIYLRLMARQGSDAPANLPQVFDTLRKDTTITVAQPSQEIRRLHEIVSNIDQILLGMAVVVLISSGIAIMLALYNSMEQRRRQIAVLRVLGCSRGRVFNLVLTESAVIGLIGALAGVAVAVGGLGLVGEIMRQRVGMVIDAKLAPDVAMIIVALTIVLAGLAGVIPAAMAYRTPVAKNLKPLG